MPQGGERGRDDDGPATRMDSLEVGLGESLRLGHDLRFLLVCVGGGAARIGASVLRKELRYVESVAVNCDPRVQGLEAFDRRVYLGSGTRDPPDSLGSPHLAGQLAHAAEPALERIFEGATFVTVVATLGGGTGTGVLPYLLDAAARASEVLSVFVVKPFGAEGERRAVAERAMARLHFLDSFVEKQQRNAATLQVLDNESLVPIAARIPMAKLNDQWSSVIATHIEHSFLLPAEAMLEATRMAELTGAEQALVPSGYRAPATNPAAPIPAPPIPLPLLSADAPSRYPGAPEDVELTFEVEGELPPGRDLT
ncbi:MAG: hypothetical protein L3K13_03865 [Thermoplasmata archaeon]|nr:hypothetical protein [Thermoplasmata archaeon]